MEPVNHRGNNREYRDKDIIAIIVSYNKLLSFTYVIQTCIIQNMFLHFLLSLSFSRVLHKVTHRSVNEKSLPLILPFFILDSCVATEK